MRGRPEPATAHVVRVGALALALPGAHEQDAWTGVRWRVRQRTFAHVLGLPHADAVRLLGVDADTAVSALVVRSAGEELAALRAAGPPYLAGRGDDVVLALPDDPDDTDWTEVAELVTESWRLLAPARLVRELDGREQDPQ